jgi:hypothetical protein
MRHPASDVESQEADPKPWLTSVDGLTLVAPPGELDGRPLCWPHGPRPAAPRWAAS